MVKDINELKKQVFFELLDLAGRVFILVRHSNSVIIGNRGFLPEEKEKGIVLVFNRLMKFEWSDTVIHATLGFGPKMEKCVIPIEEITAVFSPELSAQFVTSFDYSKGLESDAKVSAPEKLPVRHPSGEKVVKVDFKKKK